MDDALEVNYAQVLRHISAAASDDFTCSTKIDGVPIRKLFVSNLAERTTFKDLISYFSSYGNVDSCFLRRNQGKSNYAFVTFSKVEDAVSAMCAGNKRRIRLHNRYLRVMAADSWHQPDSIEQRYCTAAKETDKLCEKKFTVEEDQYQQNETENVSIHMLNDDCLRHIFRFLPIIDRVRIEIVCKRWRDLSQDSWHMMKTLDLSPSTWGFTHTHTINTALLRKILLKCGKFLTRINLNDPSHCLGQSTLTIIGKLCPNLTSVDVTGLSVCSSGIRTLANNCKNVTRFNVGQSTYCCDMELKYFFKQNENLGYLGITKNTIGGKCLLCLPPKTMHTIILDRCDCLQDNHVAIALKNLENLKHLAINDCVGIATHTMETIGQHCQNLRTLEFNGDFPSTQTIDMFHLTHLVNLQVLKLTHNIKVSDEFLAHLVQHCQQLTNVNITGCFNVSDVGLTAIGTLSKLEKLVISYMNQITDDGLKNVCGLKELECRKCSFSDRGMINFMVASSQLQVLDISGCKNITDATLHAADAVCSNRINNIMLKIFVGGTAMKESIIREKTQDSPLLHIVNVDLSDVSTMSEVCLLDDLDFLYDQESDFSDYIEFSDFSDEDIQFGLF